MKPDDQSLGYQERHSVAGTYQRWRIDYREADDTETLKRILRERIKELNGLYTLARIAESKLNSIEDILEATIGIIPPIWQYPGITVARITFADHLVQTPDYKLTRWRQSSPIKLGGEPVGEVIVCYTEEMPRASEGPFQSEERVLLDAIAERIGCMALRVLTEATLRDANHQLTVERSALKETNLALKVLMARIEEEKREIKRDILDRVEKVLKPILLELTIAVPRSQRKFIDLVIDNLEDITLPYAHEVSNVFDTLTPTETQICTMIRSGLRTKEIAELRCVSQTTVCRHRDRIRRKLGITNTTVNLATYLKKQM